MVVLHVLMTELGFQFKGNFDKFFGNGNNVKSVALVVVLHVLMTELGFQFKGNFDEFFGNGNNVKHDRFRWLGHLERIGVWNPCE